MIQLNYPSKKDLKSRTGERLNYSETSLFGPEYKSQGTFIGINRPILSGQGREFIAEVTMKDDLILHVN